MTKNTSSPDKSSTQGTKKSSSQKERRFQYDDRRYIDRDQMYVLQISQAILTQGVEELNCGKVGRPWPAKHDPLSDSMVASPKLHDGLPERHDRVL